MAMINKIKDIQLVKPIRVKVELGKGQRLIEIVCKIKVLGRILIRLVIMVKVSILISIVRA